MAYSSVGSPSGTANVNPNVIFYVITQPALPVKNFGLSPLGQNVINTAQNFDIPTNTGNTDVNPL